MTIRRALRKAGLAGLLAGTIAFGTSTFGLDGFLNGIAYPAGGAIANRIQGKKTTLEDIVKNSMAGTLMTPVLQYGWKQMERYVPVERLSAVYTGTGSVDKTISYASSNASEYAARAAVIGGYFQPYVTAAQTVVENAVDGTGPAGLYRKFRHEWWKKTKNAIYKVSPLIFANTLLIPAGYNVAFGALVFMTTKIIFSLEGRKRKEHQQPLPAYSSA